LDNRADFLVYLITDVMGAGAACELPPDERLAIQLRDRAAGGAALFAAAARLCKAGHRVYVNDRVDVALAAGCEGVHLPLGGLAASDARVLGRLRIGVSTHAPSEVADAHAAGADFCVLGPIFATPGKAPPLGTRALTEAAGGGLPVYALGGVDVANARACLGAGARGVAAIRAGAELARALAAGGLA
jgi:thiamine-phosphate pyrophosphorylase